MPSASANISAKFIAQIEMSKAWESRNRLPAEAASPRIVSRSGRPAATSDPNASTRIASVTGQEISSDFIMASLLAVLKSDHMPGAPVSDTVTPLPPRSASSPFRSSAARTISVGDAAAPAWTRIALPSCVRWSGAICETRSSAAMSSPAFAATASRSPWPLTTAISA